jgi:hypothetical protein
MSKNNERRKEQRLRYHWPIWFAENFNEVLTQGQMVDISSRAASFTCYNDGSCPYAGQNLTARFSVPCYGPDDSFDMTNFVRTGNICRVDSVNGYLRHVAIQFFDPLPFKPGEQTANETNTQEALKPVMA